MRDSRKGILPLLLLVSFLIAFPFRIERSFQWFRLRKIEVKSCPSVRVERLLLSSMDARALRFWPILLFDNGASFKDVVQGKEPLRVSRKIGLGDVEFKVVPLEVAFAFRWNDKRWFLSRDGLVWQDSHPLNEEYYGVRSDDFSIVIDPSMSPPVSGDSAVLEFNYDVHAFIAFIEKVSSLSWPGKLEALRLYREGGVELGSLYLSRRDGGGFFTVIVDRDRELSGVVAAVSDLIDSGAVTNSGSVIDSSYEGKIIARDI